MIKTSTPNDVIRFAYGEVSSLIEKKRIENSIINDKALSDLYFETLSVKKEIDNFKREPSEQTIDKILFYSKNFPLHAVNH